MKLKVYPRGYGRDVYRIIQVPNSFSLDELCDGILDAFNFDHDHLFEFILAGMRILCSRAADDFWDEEEMRTTDEISLDDFNFYKGAKFLLHYDFGDDWYFVINVMNPEEDEKKSKWIKVIKEKGKLKQYQSWDDDDETDNDDDADDENDENDETSDDD